jgi:hypothetical protein
MAPPVLPARSSRLYDKLTLFTAAQPSGCASPTNAASPMANGDGRRIASPLPHKPNPQRSPQPRQCDLQCKLIGPPQPQHAERRERILAYRGFARKIVIRTSE